MVIILGPPGAGKSMQASLLEKNGVAKWFSTGKLLREHLKGEAKEEQNKGELMPLEITGKVLHEAITQVDDSQYVILDGFPRTDEQVDWLFSDANPRDLDGVIYIDLSEEEALARIQHRRDTENRQDDTEEVIKRRFEIFHEENQPILDHFAKRGVAIEKVDGHGEIEEVHQRVKVALNELSGHR